MGGGAQGAHQGLGAFKQCGRDIHAFLQRAQRFEQRARLAVDGVGAAQKAAGEPSKFGQQRARQLARQHLPHAVGQVVRLVTQHGDRPRPVKDALDVHPGVQRVVIVANHHIGQHAQRQAVLKGAQGVSVGHALHKGGVPWPLRAHGSNQRRLLPQEMPGSAGAVRRVAAYLVHGADFFLGVEGQGMGAQAQRRHAGHLPLHGAACRAPCCQAEYLPGQPHAQCLERRVQHGRRFAGARRHHGKQALFAQDGQVHLLGHGALPLAVLRVGEGQLRQALVPARAVAHQALVPGGVLIQQLKKDAFQVICRICFFKRGAQLARSGGVAHAHRDVGQVFLPAQDVGVAQRLIQVRPPRRRRRVTPAQLDFLHQRRGQRGVVQVHPPGDVKVDALPPPCPLQGHLAAGPAVQLAGQMGLPPFLHQRGGKGHDVRLKHRKLHQRAHRQADGGGAAYSFSILCHCYPDYPSHLSYPARPVRFGLCPEMMSRRHTGFSSDRHASA